MRRVAGYVLFAVAAALLGLEALAVLARFATFAGLTEAVHVTRWQWADLLRVGGAVLAGAAGYRLVMSANGAVRPPR